MLGWTSEPGEVDVPALEVTAGLFPSWDKVHGEDWCRCRTVAYVAPVLAGDKAGWLWARGCIADWSVDLSSVERGLQLLPRDERRAHTGQKR